MFRTRLYFALTLVCQGVTVSVSGPVSRNAVPDLFEKVMKAVDRAIGFFSEDYSTLNVDGMFGIRIAQGSVVIAARDCRSGKLNCPDDLTTTLENFVTTMDSYGKKAMSYIEQEDEAYYRQFLVTIDSPYIFNVSFESIGDTTGVVAGQREEYDETEGDRCFSLIMGTADNGAGSYYPKCSVDEKCWKMMTEPNMKAYAITHQLLYFIMVQKTECSEKIDEYVQKFNKTTIREFERQLCKTIYVETLSEEEDARVKELKQDLFLEQMVLCGMAGYEDFMKESWLRMMLSWQKPQGCYGLPSSLMFVEKELVRVQMDEKHLLQLLTDEATKLESNPAGRKLMREKIMQGDCLAHKTGLAFGTLGVSLRYLINLLFSV